MSGAGHPVIHTDGTGLRVTIVAGQWHPTIADGLRAGARRVLEQSGATVSEVLVPGSFELPVVAKAALDGGADAVVALGVIVRGGTPHFEYVAAAATDGLTRVALDTGKAVGFGVLTVDDEKQGLDRAGLPGSTEDKGAEAAEAALATATVLRGLGTERTLG
jgi:6,7-dimethyl-8-ribityllumazine synthase